MSKLRKQLQHAKREYESQRYPGDLAADVLGRAAPTAARSHWVRNLALAAALAVAATVAIVVVNRDSTTNEVATITKSPGETVNVDPTTNSGGSTDPVATNDEDVEETWSLVPGQSTQTEEASVSFVPSFQSMSFSLPNVSVGGLDSYTEDETSQTPSVQ